MEIIVIIVSLVVVIAQVESHGMGFGSCPNIAPMKTFDLDKFKGGWFVIQKFSTSNTCMTYNYTTGQDGKLRIIQKSKHYALNVVGVDDFVYTGVLTFPDSEKEPGRMRVKFPLNIAGEADYLIFMTDYDNYGVIFSCQKLLFGHTKSVSILSRNSTLEVSTLTKIRQQLKDEGLDIDDLSTVDHSECERPDDGGTKLEFGGDKAATMKDNNLTVNPALAVSTARLGQGGGGGRRGKG